MIARLPDWFVGANLTQSYLELNQHLGKVVFSGRFTGRAVYLTLETSEQNELARRLGCDVAKLGEFSSNIVSKNLHTSRDPYTHISSAAKKWRFFWPD